MSQVISFLFNDILPAIEQDKVLSKIGLWTEVDKVSRLKPDGRRPEIRRLCYLITAADADNKKVVKKLLRTAGIQSATIQDGQLTIPQDPREIKTKVTKYRK